MRFHPDDDQLALRDVVRAFCADRSGLAAVADREGEPADASLWRGLADLGVLGVLAPDGDADGEGGAGTGVVEAVLAFEELGASLVSGPVIWSTIAASLVPGVADGAVRVAGVEHRDPARGPVVVEHADESDVVVVLFDDRVEALDRADLPAGSTGSPLDPLTPTTAFAALPTGRVIGDAAAARRLRLLGTVLHAAALVGVARGALDVARGYALERVQFGVPIGSFQAVKHLLADMYVRVELARAEGHAAAALAADPRAGDPERAASAAKLLAGEAGLANARAAVQILGGMGFTWDMLPHYFLKRAWVLEHGFGTGSWHAARLADAVGADVAAGAP